MTRESRDYGNPPTTPSTLINRSRGSTTSGAARRPNIFARHSGAAELVFSFGEVFCIVLRLVAE